MPKKSLMCLLCTFLISCQAAQTPIITTKNFNKKAIENNDIGNQYFGDWFLNDVKRERRRNDEKQPSSNPSQVPNGTAIYSLTPDKVNQNRAKLDDVPGGFIAESYNIEEDDTLYPIALTPTSGNWQNIATNNNYSKPSGNGYLTSDGKPYPIIESVGNTPTIQDLSYDSYSPDNFSSFTITSTNYKYLFSNSSSNTRSVTRYPSTSWKQKGSYYYSYDKNAYAEINFFGTNIVVMTKKGGNPGWNNLKAEIYKKLPNGQFPITPEKVIENIDMYNPTEIDYELKIGGLKRAEYKLILKTSDISRSQGKNSFLFAVGDAKSYNHIQYNFEGKNIAYKAFKYNTAGMVNVTVDDKLTKKVNLYSYLSKSSAINSEYVFGAKFDANKRTIYVNNQAQEVPHTITIEATGENGTTFGGSEINIDQLGILPQIEGTLKERPFNMFFAKGNDFGKADLYLDDKYFATVDLNKNNSYPPEPDFEGEGFGSTGGAATKFTLVPAFEENLISGKYKISFDAYSRSINKATFNFSSFDYGKIYYQGATGKDKGDVRLTFVNTTSGIGGSLPPFSLYGPDAVQSLVSTGVSTEYDIAYGNNYSLTVEPALTKHPSSTSYNANISKIEFKSISNQNLNMDLICTP